MAELYTYNGTHLTTVRENSAEFTLSAELGAVGSGRFVIEDTAGTVAIVGQKDFAHTESSCASNLTFRGYVADRRYTREADPQVAASRNIEVTLSDLNDMLTFRLISGSDGKRPAETVAARGAWLMASDYVTFDDNGRCSFSSAKGMDAADYRGQYAGDVLADMALAQGGVNYHVNDYGSGPELTFRDDNASTADSCALTISNDLTDSSSLHPFKDAVLTRSPANVYSKLAYAYAKGTVYEERTATATAFNGERGGTASNSNITTSAKASDEAETILWQHHTEADYIEVTVLATSAQVNLMPPGWRIQAKFTHLDTEGYGDFTWFRIIQVTRKPIVADGALYEVHLRLTPQEAGPAAASIVQSAFFRFGPGGGTMTLPNPVTIGNHLVYAAGVRAQSGTPAAPNTEAGPARFGAGAWTRFNGSDPTRASSIFGGGNDGCAMWWKEADSTEQECAVLNQYLVVGIFEIAGADPSSATLVDVDASTGAPYSLGSSGTVASGDVAIGVLTLGVAPDEWPWGGGGPYSWAQVNPAPNMTSDWTVGISQWAYDHYFLADYIPAHPWTTIAYLEGDGAAHTFAVDPGDSTHGFGGLCVVIPSA